MWLYLLQGIGFGFAAASQPGPFQTFLISQALTRGWKRSLPGALAPLVSDGPIILLSVLALSQLPDWVQRLLYIAGGLFVLYLAYGAYKSWRNFDETISHPDLASHQTVLKAAMTNALSPGPYLFWMFVTGPILVEGWRETPTHGLALLIGFYATMILSLAAIIIIFGAASKLGPKLNRTLLGISCIVLFGFGLYELWKGTA
jgi:threonine/homoserine/homoserine lactone efflux protein